MKEPTERTFLDLSVQESGNSLQVTIPSGVIEDSGTEKGDTVAAKFDREDGTFTVFLG